MAELEYTLRSAQLPQGDNPMPNPRKSRDLVIGRKKKPVKPGPTKTRKPPDGGQEYGRPVLISLNVPPGRQLSLHLTLTEERLKSPEKLSFGWTKFRGAGQPIIVVTAPPEGSAKENDVAKKGTDSPSKSAPPPNAPQTRPASAKDDSGNPSSKNFAHLPIHDVWLNTPWRTSGAISDPRSEAVRVSEFQNEGYYVEPKMPPDFCYPYPAKRIADMLTRA